jgi:Lon protease-like protein
MQQDLLPLFPLSVVLFPRTPLPLHIFEERYKEMIGEALRTRSEFGIVLANEKGIVNVGCSASVEKVIKTYASGEMDIFTVGRRRFEILDLNEEKAYLRGTVSYFDDEDFEPPVGDQQRQVVRSYYALRDVDKQAGAVEPELTDPQLSFQIAAAIADLDFRQLLLRTRSEADRIRQLAEFLPGYLTKRRRVAHALRVAPHNGKAAGN